MATFEKYTESYHLAVSSFLRFFLASQIKKNISCLSPFFRVLLKNNGFSQQQNVTQSQHPMSHHPQPQQIGRNISAMLDENNTVVCYLEPITKS